ncbi:MAG: FAD-binding oxidoreductase, partial [Actinobacteria bacterium]|nr:FAD-binding oxidoreductase [Actinomycetota bacterium]
MSASASSRAGTEGAGVPERFKWWGWGDAAKRAEVPETTRAALRSELGVEAREATDPAALESVSLPAPHPIPAAVRTAAGEGGLDDGAEARLRHAAGRSYPDLVRLRSGSLELAPDAVATPATREQVAALLAACAESGVAVVPYGGGSSVVGGVDALAGPHSAVLSLGLGRLRNVELDRTSLTARLGPGLRGPEAETELRRLGMTLGHFPQSYEQATIGGYAATRSAGQASTGYGRFDELVTAIELTAPAGAMRTLQIPHTAAGPSLRELVLGSEGTLGVITEVGCRVRPVPEEAIYEGWMAEDFRAGAEIVRALAQEHEAPDVLRLSDEEETRVSMVASGSGGWQRRALDAYLGVRRRRGGCLVICGY